MTQTQKDTETKKAQTGSKNGPTAAADGLEGFEMVGKNVQWQMQGHMLVIAIDTTQKFGQSASGKSNIVASTSGNIPIPLADGTSIVLGVNAYTKVAKSGK